MNEATRQAVRNWLEMHHGNVEALARWMSRTARIGGIKACRALILEATA